MQSSVPGSPSYTTFPPPIDSQMPRLSDKAFSAVSWPAIFGGVFVALSVSVVLTILGSGLGFAARSPWMDASAAKTLGVIAVIWMIVIQWLASALGGYITGRLRTRWVNVHTHEVFFRDTAHGFVTWAVATVLMLAVFTWVASMAGHAATNITAHAFTGYATSAEAGRTNASSPDMNPMAYYSDRMFRIDRTATQAGTQSGTQAGTQAPVTAPDTNGAVGQTGQAVPPAAAQPDVRGEANRILLKGVRDNGMSDEDKTYLTQLVVVHTGLSEADARKRVDNVIAEEKSDADHAKEVADNARKTASVLSISIALSLIIGAFVASVAAALGGNIRDRHN